MEEVGRVRVLETAFATLCDCGAEGAGDYDLGCVRLVRSVRQGEQD